MNDTPQGPPRERQHRFDPGSTLVLGIVLALLWTALSGGTDFGFGSVAIVATVLASQWLAPIPAMTLSPRGLLGFIGYFLHGSLAGATDVARRALSPGLPLAVTRHWHVIALPAGPPRAMLIGTITLLPGTLSAQLDGDRLLVHSIAGDARERIDELEARVAAMFALDGAAGDA